MTLYELLQFLLMIKVGFPGKKNLRALRLVTIQSRTPFLVLLKGGAMEHGSHGATEKDF